jgi:hypothetical protein
MTAVGSAVTKLTFSGSKVEFEPTVEFALVSNRRSSSMAKEDRSRVDCCKVEGLVRLG